MALNKSFALTAYRKNADGLVTTATVQITYTDPDFPGVQSLHTGICDISYAGITDETNKSAMVTAFKDTVAPMVAEWDRFHYDQVRFNYNVANSTEVVVTAITPPEAPFPTLNRAQVLIGLASINITEDMIDAEIQKLPTDQAPYAMIDWKNRVNYQRDNPLVRMLQASFSLSDETVDHLWRWSFSQ